MTPNAELTSLQQAVADEFNTCRGRVLGLIESWGLPMSQEKACKSIFKSLTYDSEARIKELVE
jgi:hypothetical protein